MKKWETKKPQKCTDDIIVNNEHTKYPVIPNVCSMLGWKTCNGDNSHKKLDWDIYWTDYGLGIERIVRRAHSYQRINHIPGMINIYRKNNLARALSRMHKLFGDLYDFFPKTWILPHEHHAVKEFLTSRQDRCVIIKPAGSAQGKGIYLALTPNMIQRSNEEMIAQEYVMRPLTIDGKKFDIRVYCLVTSVEPLRILVYNEGLVRLCTASYNVPDSSNVYDSFMHLTNYAVNKYNVNFVQSNDTVQSEDVSNKRSLSWLWKWMKDQGMNHHLVWRGICDIIVKTLLSTQSYLSRAYGACKMSAQDKNPFTCFEILGFDILLTDTLIPILLEVNHTPSFRMDSKLDERIKTGLVTDTMRLLNVHVGERNRYYLHKAAISQVRLYGSTFDDMGDEKRRMGPREISAEHYWKKYKENESQHLGNFALIYPTEDYPNQPTRGMQKVYDYVLSAANAMISVSGGVYTLFNLDEIMPMPFTTTTTTTTTPSIVPNNSNNNNSSSSNSSNNNSSSNSSSSNSNSGSSSNSSDIEDVTKPVSDEGRALCPMVRPSNQSQGGQGMGSLPWQGLEQEQVQGEEQKQGQPNESREGGYRGIRGGAMSFPSAVPSLATAAAVTTISSSASEKTITSMTMMQQQQQQQQQAMTPQPPGQGLGQGSSGLGMGLSPRRIVTHENTYMSQPYRRSGGALSYSQQPALPSAVAVPISSEQYHSQHHQYDRLAIIHNNNNNNNNNKVRANSLPFPLAMGGPALSQEAEHEMGPGQGQKMGILGGLGPLVSAACGIASTWGGWAPDQGQNHKSTLVSPGSHIDPTVSLIDSHAQPSSRPGSFDDRFTDDIAAATPHVSTAGIQRLDQPLTTPPRHPHSNHSPPPTSLLVVTPRPISTPPLFAEIHGNATNVRRTNSDKSLHDNHLTQIEIANGSTTAAAVPAWACVPPTHSKASRTATKPSPSPLRASNPLTS